MSFERETKTARIRIETTRWDWREHRRLKLECSTSWGVRLRLWELRRDATTHWLDRRPWSSRSTNCCLMLMPTVYPSLNRLLLCRWSNSQLSCRWSDSLILSHWLSIPVVWLSLFLLLPFYRLYDLQLHL